VVKIHRASLARSAKTVNEPDTAVVWCKVSRTCCKESDETRKSEGLGPGVSQPIVVRNPEYSLPASQKSLTILLAEFTGRMLFSDLLPKDSSSAESNPSKDLDGK
jgi:hypothetical protein